jgi:integrase
MHPRGTVAQNKFGATLQLRLTMNKGQFWLADIRMRTAAMLAVTAVHILVTFGTYTASGSCDERRRIMGVSDLDPDAHGRRPWNAGNMVGAKRPLKPRDVWAIRFFLDEHRRLRDRALFDLAIDSKLRGCDIVKMKIGDIVVGGALRTRATVVQQKTHRPVQFELMTEARKTLLTWLTRRRGTLDDFIFPSRINYMGHLSTRQYARLVDEWVGAVGLNVAEYGTHSMRRTKASLIYKATGNLRAVQILLGHSNIENTVRYLGVDIDDAITLAERTEI